MKCKNASIRKSTRPKPGSFDAAFEVPAKVIRTSTRPKPGSFDAAFEVPAKVVVEKKKPMKVTNISVEKLLAVEEAKANKGIHMFALVTVTLSTDHVGWLSDFLSLITVPYVRSKA